MTQSPKDSVGAHCLFLSHSGADTEAARELKRRILESPDARDAGLKVWFDKDDLSAGRGWQEQIEIAITREATAFAVYVGSKGVMNWVEREVRLGLARATGEAAIPFIPILAHAIPDMAIAALPPFAQQHEGVVDPLRNPAQLAKLIDSALGRASGPPPRLTDEPFVGLRPMTEREADRFFGRAAEVAELADDLRRSRLVAIVADSGAGKSSLAMAGLAPAFRGGVLADPARRGPDDLIWHVVVARPGSDPLEGLRRGLTEAAEHMGLSADARAGLRRRLTFDEANEAAYALRCDLPANSTETLLIVDQFDELLTETPEPARVPFLDFILKLAAMRSPGGFYVVLTVRVDYFNLCRPYSALYQELQGVDRVLRLKRISDAGLEEAVRAPLRMAGFSDESEQKALAAATRHDLGDRPGDLALAQMALWTVWRNRNAYGGSLLKAYIDVGGVAGALAQEAERIRTQKLSVGEQELLLPLFVRLIRLGETGGVLRRLAKKEEFEDARRALAEKLAADEYGRLLLVGEGRDAGGANIEVCHEALITQWPWLQNALNAAAADLRVLERLMDRAARWREAPESERAKHLATGAERELFAEFRGRREAWLSSVEQTFVADSQAAYLRDQAAKQQAEKRLKLLGRRVLWTTVSLLLVMTGAVIVATYLLLGARKERARADEQRDHALLTQSYFLADLASQQINRSDAVTGMLLSLEALPDVTTGNGRPFAPQAEFNLYSGAIAQRESTVLGGHVRAVPMAAFSPDGKYIASASWDGTGRLWDAATHRQLAVLTGSPGELKTIAFSPAGTEVVTAGEDHSARVWQVPSGRLIVTLSGHTDKLNAASFDPAGSRVVTASDDHTARIFDTATGRELIKLDHNGAKVSLAIFHPSGKYVLTAAGDNVMRLWDAASGTLTMVFTGHGDEINSITFDHSGDRILSTSGDHTARIWSTQTGREAVRLEGHTYPVETGVFSPDGRLVATGSNDDTVKIWEAETGKQLGTMSGFHDIIWSVKFDPRGRMFVAASRDHNAGVCDLAKNICTLLGGHDDMVKTAEFSPSGREILTSSNDGTVRLWNVETFIGPARLSGHTKEVVSAVFDPTGTRVLTASDDGTARIFDADNHEQLAVLTGHAKGLIGAVFSPDGSRIVTYAVDKTARLWEASGRLIAVLQGHTAGAVRAVFSPDSKLLATYAVRWSNEAADPRVLIWETSKGHQARVLEGHSDSVSAVAFSADGKLIATASADGTARIWDAAIHRQLMVLQDDESAPADENERAVLSVAFDPAGKQLVTGSADKKVRVWDLATGRRVAILAGHTGGVTAIFFSPDGKLILTSSGGFLGAAPSLDTSVRLWDSTAYQRIAVLSGHVEQQSMPFSPDSARVVTASPGKLAELMYPAPFARVWDARKGGAVALLDGSRSRVDAASYSPDGRRVVAASDDGSVLVWPVFAITQALIDRAKESVPRCLTQAQRRQYFLELEPPQWCVEKGLWPYDTEAWKSWLSQKKLGQNPALPASDQRSAISN